MDEDDFPSPQELGEMAQDTKMVQVANLILSQAVRDRATAIHLETQADSMRVRYRVDGELALAMNPPWHIRHALIGRFKQMAELDLFERRVPQSGRFAFRQGERDFEMHLSTLPCANGEKITIGVQGCEEPRGLDQLALSESNLERLKGLLARRSGLILVSGGSGSGKTTTLYSCLKHLSEAELNITTLEARLRYRVPEFNQVTLNGKVGLTLATALQHTLQSDPDVIMIGFLRGAGSVELALESACRGHLVLAGTYHESAVQAAHSLLHVGAEAALVADAYRGGVGQRMVRVNCPDCTQPLPDTPYFRGGGCENCWGRGTRGLMGVHEVLLSSAAFREQLMAKASLEALGEAARGDGMQFLDEDALGKVKTGQLGPGEVLRLLKS